MTADSNHFLLSSSRRISCASALSLYIAGAGCGSRSFWYPWASSWRYEETPDMPCAIPRLCDVFLKIVEVLQSSFYSPKLFCGWNALRPQLWLCLLELCLSVQRLWFLSFVWWLWQKERNRKWCENWWSFMATGSHWLKWTGDIWTPQVYWTWTAEECKRSPRLTVCKPKSKDYTARSARAKPIHAHPVPAIHR